VRVGEPQDPCGDLGRIAAAAQRDARRLACLDLADYRRVASLPGSPIRADTAGRLALQPVKFPLRDRQMPRVGITLPVERTANDLTGEVDTMKANLKQRRAEKSYGVPPLS
jgi:hypothetical protein